MLTINCLALHYLADLVLDNCLTWFRHKVACSNICAILKLLVRLVASLKRKVDKRITCVVEIVSAHMWYTFLFMEYLTIVCCLRVLGARQDSFHAFR